MESQNGLTRVITLKASVSVPGAQEGEVVRAWLPVAAACRQQSHIEVLDMTSEVPLPLKTFRLVLSLGHLRLNIHSR